MDTKGLIDHEGKPLTREDVERLLQNVGSSDKLDLTHLNLKGIDLSEATLSGANLSKTYTIGADFREANLSKANLSDASFSATYLFRTVLAEANLNKVGMQRAILIEANLHSADLTGADLIKSSLAGADISEAILEGARLDEVNLDSANLREANLYRAHLDGALLANANLRGARLVGASLARAVLFGADLRNADLRNADLREANLYRAHLDGALLANADLRGARLVGQDLHRDNFKEAILGEDNHSATNLMNSENGSVLHIRIIEDPLTAQNLSMIISALTELSTKYWLIAKGRFADLIEYTQTHNGRFAEEAKVIVTKVTYNSPMNMDWKVDLSASNVAEALVTTIDGITQIRKRFEQAELATQAKAQEIKHAEQQADHEQQMALLEQEQRRLEIEKQRLEVLEKQLEVQKKGIEYALEIAGKVVDLLRPGADPAARTMEIQALLPNLVQLQNGKGLELALPAVQNEKSADSERG